MTQKQSDLEREEVLNSFAIMAPTAIFYNSIPNPTEYQEEQIVLRIEALTKEFRCRNLILASSASSSGEKIADYNFPLLSPFIEHLVILSRDSNTREIINLMRKKLDFSFEITVVRTLKEALELLR